MCCRCYVEYLKDAELKKMYDLLKDKTEIKTEGEIFPTDNMIVIAKSKDNKINVFKMKWGYNIGKNNVFNARMETIETNIFKDGIENRRCVVPVSNYYEWEKESKDKYKLKAKETVTYLLGVYRIEDGKPVFSIITKEATEKMRDIHDRMPLAIPKDRISSWIFNNELKNKIMKESLDEFDRYKMTDISF